jgi:acetyl esterase/lipase
VAVLALAPVVVLALAPQEIHWERDVTFAEPGGTRLALDLARPVEGDRAPAMLCLHGGGWSQGNRQNMHGIVEDWAELGYVAATASYRLVPGATWPAQLDDVVAALAFLRKNAARFRLDPERIGATGFSAGGHLALMLGLDEARTAVAGGPVRVVVNYFGPTDLRALEQFKDAAGLVRDLAGNAPFADLSPAAFVNVGDAPVLTLQGTKDPLVSPRQACSLHALLQRTAVPTQLELLEGLGHGWRGKDLAHTQDMAQAFAGRYLHASQPPLTAADFDTDADVDAFELFDPGAWHRRGDGRTRLALAKKSDYAPTHRSPTGLAILRAPQVGSFTLDVDARSTTAEYDHRDLCLVFGYQSPTRFYYAHLASKPDERAHGVFLVNDADRANIVQTKSEGVRWGDHWHRLRVRRDAASGRIEVFVDDFATPALTATDRTFVTGRVGFGSFDDQGEFDALRLYGDRVAGG